MVPAEDARKIREHARINVPDIMRYIDETHHDVTAFLRSCADSLGDESRWVHYGLTSNDVWDTATCLQLVAATAVLAAQGRRRVIACASTGNAASSLAGMAASLGLRAVIFVPERAPEPKLAQLLIFGATVLRVRGGYAAAWDLCQSACERWGWYNRNCAVNPYLVEGKKTAGLEIAEQLGTDLPDWVVVSVGDGCTIGGVGEGFGAGERPPRRGEDDGGQDGGGYKRARSPQSSSRAPDRRG